MDKNHPCYHDLRNYVVGFVLSLVLSGAAFWVVLGSDFSRNLTLCLVGVLGVAQLLVQFRYFLHLNGKRENREDLYLVLFSTLVFIIMVLGTIWILGSLANRMDM
ncbi:cytochrome o ubiquinol oxidase subunit IV [Akkermansiaceae bacterium]|nr:cytochrome o ubiquinol oxidase subunit IV [Akkermansiaceae bacterium]